MPLQKYIWIESIGKNSLVVVYAFTGKGAILNSLFRVLRCSISSLLRFALSLRLLPAELSKMHGLELVPLSDDDPVEAD